jgi:hypothetical protein
MFFIEINFYNIITITLCDFTKIFLLYFFIFRAFSLVTSAPDDDAKLVETRRAMTLEVLVFYRLIPFNLWPSVVICNKCAWVGCISVVMSALGATETKLTSSTVSNIVALPTWILLFLVIKIFSSWTPFCYSVFHFVSFLKHVYLYMSDVCAGYCCNILYINMCCLIDCYCFSRNKPFLSFNQRIKVFFLKKKIFDTHEIWGRIWQFVSRTSREFTLTLI